jgi:hypothetical protein
MRWVPYQPSHVGLIVAVATNNEDHISGLKTRWTHAGVKDEHDLILFVLAT